MLDKHKATIKSATLTRHKLGNYELPILVDTMGNIEALNGNLLQSQPSNEVMGIDLGITNYIVDSEEIRCENTKSIRKKIKKLSILGSFSKRAARFIF